MTSAGHGPETPDGRRFPSGEPRRGWLHGPAPRGVQWPSGGGAVPDAPWGRPPCQDGGRLDPAAQRLPLEQRCRGVLPDPAGGRSERADQWAPDATAPSGGQQQRTADSGAAADAEADPGRAEEQ